ncbi:MAG: alkaline phosphatase family protein [Myxococcales bacterium]|nr:alkaline phosphatase family protein [Myxococcales bacterium]MBK7198988.1 alkaline phosphatase family protein [Myxococcales bacterium]MBP6848333.1 alkaline phosphatase family protein [Kofleriaceae bacterium]
MKRAAIVGAALLLALALALVARGALGRWLAGDGVGRAQRPLRTGPAAPRPPRAPLRVVILDGLAAADAHTPALDRLCARGAELAIDVGFPTKSLPVQAALWTGLTAQQLGLGPTNAARTLPPGALPTQVPDALAVVEAWTVIARTVGFAEVRPTADADWASAGATPAAVARWRAEFPAAARAAVASPRALVLVHVLAIDRAAHAGGRGDAGYRAAIADADRLLGALVAARPDATWVVMSDHGHRAGGGHGDVEPAVRLVRGCVTPAPPGAPPRGPAHLVDVARHLRDVLGVAPRTGAVGRRLATAMAAPDPDATLPRAGWLARIAAVVTLALTGALALRRARPRWLIAWLPLAVAAYLAWRGVPSLSSRDRAGALACALIAAAPALALARRDRRALGAIAISAGGAALALVIAAGVPPAMLDGTPPARPYVTAWLDVGAPALALVAGLAGALAALSATPDRGDRGQRPGPGRVRRRSDQ